MITRNDLVKTFNYFFEKLYTTDKKGSTVTADKICDNFLIKINKQTPIITLSTTFLWRYGYFQYNYWRKILFEEKLSDKKLDFNFFYGNKAIERYNQRNQKFDWIMPQIVEKEFEVKLTKKKEKKIFTKNPIRQLYLNTQRGFDACIVSTTLFDHQDSSCHICNYKHQCRELLKTNYPRIWKERGYDGKTTNE